MCEFLLSYKVGLMWKIRFIVKKKDFTNVCSDM